MATLFVQLQNIYGCYRVSQELEKPGINKTKIYVYSAYAVGACAVVAAVAAVFYGIIGVLCLSLGYMVKGIILGLTFKDLGSFGEGLLRTALALNSGSMEFAMFRQAWSCVLSESTPQWFVELGYAARDSVIASLAVASLACSVKILTGLLSCLHETCRQCARECRGH